MNAFTNITEKEHDACGIFSSIDKTGVPTVKTVHRGIQALKALRHRAGYVHNEGDGCGILIDIPRELWERRLQEAGCDPELAYDNRFFVGHWLLRRAEWDSSWTAMQDIFREANWTICTVELDAGCLDALGPSASRENPVFVQVVGLLDAQNEGELHRVGRLIEARGHAHTVSVSHYTVVYKVVGDGHTLQGYYKDLRDDACKSSYVLAHTRYSTNTATSFMRVQPFSLLGHNGEINTITRFAAEAAMVDIPLDPNYSDSQMVNEVLHTLVSERGWTLFEAAELLFPPIVNEIKQMSSKLADMYMFMRSQWGPFSQGPAAMMMRFGREAVYTLDALGLRPMWVIDTDDAYVLSSEQGIIPTSEWVAEPRPLSPGEKVGFSWEQGRVVLHRYPTLQNIVLERMQKRYTFTGESRNIRFTSAFQETEPAVAPRRDRKPLNIRTAAYGWREDDFKLLEFESQTSVEPIRSLGYDGPLPALDDSIRLISDFLQETVAVVTNPAIDREREIEHFSTRTVLGKRPSLANSYTDAPRVEIQSPLLLEELPADCGVTPDEIQSITHRHSTRSYEDVLAALHNNLYSTVEILIHREESESIDDALDRFRREALEAVQAGANIIVLDDRLQFSRGRHIDPFLCVAVVHRALQRPASSQGGEHLRRRTSLILRSGGIRNLHDIAVAIGLGCDAVNPYLIWEITATKGNLQAIDNVYTALCKGLEKVISTIGIHEVRGYDRMFSAIGLDPQVAGLIGVPNFCGRDGVGYGFEQMNVEAEVRQALYNLTEEKQLKRARPFQIYPRIWKAAGLVADGSATYDTFVDRLSSFEQDNPISLRHLLNFRTDALQSGVGGVEAVSEEDVDTSVDIHSYPLVISSMSFGSQGETAYRAYAEAAYRLNIVGLNGEGGEIKDLLRKYPRNRGRQVASGRFGVNAELCNGTYMLEIKIGQGAKPGEGGHLPGSKVTVQVANARNATPGTDLISPSNNHDIYSIEDLAQVIYELREINPEAKIAVKVPVVPNIGTIAVGIVKAGADVVTLSGFDGGTGAARAHALRHVGLPMEIGVKLAHEALCSAGLRECAEIWADGGMKSGLDAMKAILLGANRVGFGTMAMVAVGCTACRACHKDTCHVGIATQMTDMEEATAKGLTAFAPREFDQAVSQLTTFFRLVGEHVRTLTKALGAKRTQDLVGRSDLLEQISGFDALDLGWLVRVLPEHQGLGTRIQFRVFEGDQQIVEEEVSTLQMAVGTGSTELVCLSTAFAQRLASGLDRIPAPGDIDAGTPVPRALGTRHSGERIRNRQSPDQRITNIYPHVAGNGYAAYHSVGMLSIAHGGAQDGVGKGAFGGKILVLKAKGPDGVWRGGSVGKGLAYGAQHGLFIVQGNADARAGIRLSGADIVIGGEVQEPLRDDLGWIGERANMKGFAFEYMTAGRALVLGDPGPWICSGMTGGTVYLRHNPEVGLTEDALKRRIAKGAKVSLRPLDSQGVQDVTELLGAYIKELRKSGQLQEAKHLEGLQKVPTDHFIMVRPGEDITDQSIATE